MKPLIDLLQRPSTTFQELQESWNAAQALCGKYYPTIQSNLDTVRRKIIKKIHEQLVEGKRRPFTLNDSLFKTVEQNLSWEVIVLTPELELIQDKKELREIRINWWLTSKLYKWHKKQVEIINAIIARETA